MKYALSFLLFLSGINALSAQTADQQQLLRLARAYRQYMFTNEPGKGFLKELRERATPATATATDFIVQTLTTDNKLATTTWLSRPSDAVLRQLYLVDRVNGNLSEEGGPDNRRLMDSLSEQSLSGYELLDNYYGLLFASIGNKNKPFDLSRLDLRLADYGLKDETERGILVLRTFRLCNLMIFGYMNIVQPPNTKAALREIRRFPTINGAPYYQYTDFFFPDFKMVMDAETGPESYKTHYLNKFFETLLFHLVVLDKEGGSKKAQQDLLLGSILREKKLYKYTEYRATLENIFEEKRAD